MADVKTESLKAVENNTSTKPTKTDKMTVEKQVGQSPILKNKGTAKEGISDETPSVTPPPTQPQVAPGNPPTSPKKSDPKNSPTSKSSSGIQPPKTPVQQQQQQGKVKVNPWHKNSPAAPSNGGVSRKGSASLAPEGSDMGASKSGSSSPQEDSSKSIQIPREGVCCMMYWVCVRKCLVCKTGHVGKSGGVWCLHYHSGILL